MTDVFGYEMSDDVDAIETLAKKIAEERNYYVPFHRGLLSVSSNAIRAEAREIIRARSIPVTAG